MAKPLQKCLEFLYKKFSDNPAGMIIVTSVTGWALSSLAQIVAIALNPKIKEEQKVFLIPQEFNDALVNIGAFLLITQVTKKTVSNLFKTGKFAPKSVKEFLNKTPELKEKIGNLDLNLDEVLAKGNPEISRTYNTYKNFGTTVATIGAGVLAANVVTPVIRNKMASRVQKSYLTLYGPSKSGNKQRQNPVDEVKPLPVKEPTFEQNPAFHAVPKPQLSLPVKGSMRI